MLGSFQVRTDLAVERKEFLDGEEEQMRGVSVWEEVDEEKEIHTTVVEIETENGAKSMGKPVGVYITLEAPNLSVADEGHHQEISQMLSDHLKQFLGKREQSVLVVGLGNRQVTPDALGPQVADQIFITRHLVKEFGKQALEAEQMNQVSALAPGVMAQTGMETSEIIKGVVKEEQPDCLIIIDALAARSIKRLNRTIQITDTGITPGSGVGNHRNGINRENLGIPVIAIGVPTVVDAATIVGDTLEEMGEKAREAQWRQKIHDTISPALNTMYVTPKDIDESIRRISYTISEGINQALKL